MQSLRQPQHIFKMKRLDSVELDLKSRILIYESVGRSCRFPLSSMMNDERNPLNSLAFSWYIHICFLVFSLKFEGLRGGGISTLLFDILV